MSTGLAARARTWASVPEDVPRTFTPQDCSNVLAEIPTRAKYLIGLAAPAVFVAGILTMSADRAGKSSPYKGVLYTRIVANVLLVLIIFHALMMTRLFVITANVHITAIAVILQVLVLADIAICFVGLDNKGPAAHIWYNFTAIGLSAAALFAGYVWFDTRTKQFREGVSTMFDGDSWPSQAVPSWREALQRKIDEVNNALPEGTKFTADEAKVLRDDSDPVAVLRRIGRVYRSTRTTVG